MKDRLRLSFASRTDTGAVREKNEDALHVCAGLGLVVLADGMGGHNAGEIASAIATRVMVDEIRPRLQSFTPRDCPEASLPEGQSADLLTEAILHANDAVIAAAREVPEYAGMGTTLVAALFGAAHATIAHVGDSRAYLFRSARLTPLTRDHSVAQEQIDAGVLSADWPHAVGYRHLLTRALGIAPDLLIDTTNCALEGGDIFLLCSDGLYDMLNHQEIEEAIALHGQSLEGLASVLLESALRNGGHDNVSLVLIGVES